MASQKPVASSLAEAARISPATVFNAPEDVVKNKRLSTPQKVEILDQWQADAEALQTATDEGMAGDTSADELDDVNKAKTKVEGEAAGRE